MPYCICAGGFRLSVTKSQRNEGGRNEKKLDGTRIEDGPVHRAGLRWPWLYRHASVELAHAGDFRMARNQLLAGPRAFASEQDSFWRVPRWLGTRQALAKGNAGALGTDDPGATRRVS